LSLHYKENDGDGMTAKWAPNLLWGCMRVARRDHMVTSYTWSPKLGAGFRMLSTALLARVEARCVPASTCSGIDIG